MGNHILLICIGSHGDVHPFIGLGQRLKARGQDVTLMTSGYFGALVQSAGVHFVEMGSAEDFLEMAGSPDIWHPQRGPMMILRSVVKNIGRVHDAVASWIRPDGRSIVVASSLGLGVRVAREHLKFRHVTVHLSPLCFRSAYAPPRIPVPLPLGRMPAFMLKAFWRGVDRFLIDPAIGPGLNDYRGQFGLPPQRRFLDRWWHSPDQVIGMFPDWFAPPQLDWPESTQLAGFPLYDEQDLVGISPRLEAFLRAGSAPIAFTPGSAMMEGHGFFRAAAEACALMKQRGILLTRHIKQIPANLPADVIHVDYVPFSLLLGRCAAAVHHGGIGSTAQSLAAGIPQLIMPMAHDQQDNADRLKRLGVGDDIARRRFTGRHVASKLSKLLGNPAIVGNAKAISKQVDHDGLTRAAETIERLSN